MRDGQAPVGWPVREQGSWGILAVLFVAGACLVWSGQVSHAGGTAADQRVLVQQGTSVAPPPPTRQRSIRFICDQQTLPNDVASCMNRAVRVYFEGDWSGVDICGTPGGTCHDLKTLLIPKR